MAKYGMTADSFKELVEKFIEESESMADLSDYYRGKADAFRTVLYSLND